MDPAPPDWSNVISGHSVDLQDVSLDLPFTPLVPSGLGDPVGVFKTDPNTYAPEDMVLEFDYDSASYGRVIVKEITPEVNEDGWGAYVQLLLKQNGSPLLHGRFSTDVVRSGVTSLLTTSEDGSMTDIRWLESPDLEVYVRGASLTEDECVKIADGL